MHNDSKEGKYQVIPIVCVDDRFGMAFNKRRCSSDVAVLRKPRQGNMCFASK